VAVHRHYGLYLAARRRPAEALAATDRAYDLDPLCIDVNTSVAWVSYVTRDHASAIERCRHTLEMDEGFVSARRLLAAALGQAGRTEEAAVELEILANGRLDPVTLAWVAHGFATIGDTARASGILEQLERLSRGGYVSAYHRALGHAAIDDRDGAFALLCRASEQREPAIVNLGVDPRFEPLGADPRYQALVESLGLPD
jgi:tetratricopeptide (TPR) repeat protein